MARVTPPHATKFGEKRLRTTDLFIKDRFKKIPLSVSTDKIGIPALRWAMLSQEFGIRDRSGDGIFFEVYPAVARMAWDLSKDNGEAIQRIREKCPLEFSPFVQQELLLRNEHAFDALICALATRAAALGLTYQPSPEMRKTAEVEGWIHAPQPGSLEQLIDAGLA